MKFTFVYQAQLISNLTAPEAGKKQSRGSWRAFVLSSEIGGFYLLQIEFSQLLRLLFRAINLGLPNLFIYQTLLKYSRPWTHFVNVFSFPLFRVLLFVSTTVMKTYDSATVELEHLYFLYSHDIIPILDNFQ